MDFDSSADAFFDELRDAVAQQLDSPATRYVRATRDRLISEGLSEDEALERIAACLAEESDRMFRSQRPFNEAAYRTSLERISPEG